jgi:hypothetical protein
MTPSKKVARTQAESTGKLRIGDDWNAITIIALSQSDPLKAIAEFVENSIDAGARTVTIVRGKEQGQPFISVTDDGDGIRRNGDGIPDFKYVATHICDSMKRRLKKDGSEEGGQDVQGEFGIGLLSFWTLGESLTLTCSAADGETYQMLMHKGDTDYSVRKRRTMFPARGTELKVKPLLPGIRRLSGEKLQWYLASELRNRIRTHDIDLRILDRTARKEFKVEPRDFGGRLIHQLPELRTREGDIYLELYLDDPSPSRKVGLYRNGTRVLNDIATLEELKPGVWNSGYLEGIIDVPFINLTPGTRLGVIRDDRFTRAWFALRQVEDLLETMIGDLKKAEEQRASRQVLNSIKRAFREALLALPAEEYDWFDVQTEAARRNGRKPANAQVDDAPSSQSDIADEHDTPLEAEALATRESGETGGAGQKEFFDFPGPLYSVRISPASCVMHVGSTRTIRALARDRGGRTVDIDVEFRWQVIEGRATIKPNDGEIAELGAPHQPQLVRLKLTATQGDVECDAEALITVTESLAPEIGTGSANSAGMPGYTFQKAAGELWRSRYDEAQNIIVVNNGHRDFVYASRTRALQLRYIARLFAKELVYKNFPGLPPEKLLERMIELSLYTEENLK